MKINLIRYSILQVLFFRESKSHVALILIFKVSLTFSKTRFLIGTNTQYLINAVLRLGFADALTCSRRCSFHLFTIHFTDRKTNYVV